MPNGQQKVFFTEGNEGKKGFLQMVFLQKVTKVTKGFYRGFLNSSTVKPAAPIIPPMVAAFILQKVTKETKEMSTEAFQYHHP